MGWFCRRMFPSVRWSSCHTVCLSFSFHLSRNFTRNNWIRASSTATATISTTTTSTTTFFPLHHHYGRNIVPTRTCFEERWRIFAILLFLHKFGFLRRNTFCKLTKNRFLMENRSSKFLLPVSWNTTTSYCEHDAVDSIGKSTFIQRTMWIFVFVL